MWDNNNYGGSAPDQSVNTNIATFFGPTSYFQLGCWNDKLSLNWVPSKGQAEGTGRPQYDKDNNIKTALTQDKVETLVSLYEEILEKKIRAGEDPGEDGLSVGVTVMSGKAGAQVETAILIEYRRSEDGNGYASYVSLARDLTPGTPPIIRYKFTSTKVIAGSSPEAGKIKTGQREGELMWFITLLRAHGDLNKYGSHQNKMTDAFKAKNGYGQQNQHNNGQYAGSESNTGFMNIPDGLPDADYQVFE